jgi:hypothetical protein
MKRTGLRSVTVLIALVASSLFGVAAPVVATSDASSVAAAEEPQCTSGNAQAVFQALPVTAAVMLPRGQDHPGLLEAAIHCQYRVQRDGESVTFCEDDVIVGGIVWFWPYEADGISRAFAIADIQLIEDRVWLNGVEQVLQGTAFKNFVSAAFGVAVFQHRAFITQLPPGDHTSAWVSTYPGFPDETATRHIHVLPRELCA